MRPTRYAHRPEFEYSHSGTGESKEPARTQSGPRDLDTSEAVASSPVDDYDRRQLGKIPDNTASANCSRTACGPCARCLILEGHPSSGGPMTSLFVKRVGAIALAAGFLLAATQ